MRSDSHSVTSSRSDREVASVDFVVFGVNIRNLAGATARAVIVLDCRSINSATSVTVIWFEIIE
jgi:hypothetical protein